jgi:hypothetical protein
MTTKRLDQMKEGHAAVTTQDGILRIASSRHVTSLVCVQITLYIFSPAPLFTFIKPLISSTSHLHAAYQVPVSVHH